MEPDDVQDEDHIVIRNDGLVYTYVMVLDRALDGRWLANVERSLGPLSSTLPERPVDESHVKELVADENYEVIENGR